MPRTGRGFLNRITSTGALHVREMTFYQVLRVFLALLLRSQLKLLGFETHTKT